MKDGRLFYIELQLMRAEYLMDSTISHTERSHCDCIRPLALRRLKRALASIRGARDRVRNLQGHKQWTLFAGSSTNAQRGKGKPWAHHTAHKWEKDCKGGHVK